MHGFPFRMHSFRWWRKKIENSLVERNIYMRNACMCSMILWLVYYNPNKTEFFSMDSTKLHFNEGELSLSVELFTVSEWPNTFFSPPNIESLLVNWINVCAHHVRRDVNLYYEVRTKWERKKCTQWTYSLSVRAYGAHYHHLPFKLDIGTILSRTSHSQVECNKHF